MVYDFDANEDGVLKITLRSHNSPSFCSVTTHDFYVKKDQAYNIEYSGAGVTLTAKSTAQLESRIKQLEEQDLYRQMALAREMATVERMRKARDDLREQKEIDDIRISVITKQVIRQRSFINELMS